MRAHVTFLQALWASRVLAVPHHFFVSSFLSPDIYSLEFDDETRQLVQTAHIKGHDGHPWISFSYDKSALYAGEKNGFASYTVENTSSLTYRRSIELKGKCVQRIPDFGATFTLPLTKAPFTVYGAPFGSCVNAMSVDADGTLQDVIQNITLESTSGIHGMAVDPDNSVMYSADTSANGIWVHQINNDSQILKELAFVQAPEAEAGPRHLIVHPNGRYLYVLMETRNEVAVYAINNGVTGQNIITFTGLKYSLIPRGADPEEYKANEVMLSADNNILYATTRYKTAEQTSNTNQRARANPGYITAILLVPILEKLNPETGHVEGPGFPLRQLFQIPSTTSGGASNAVTPAPWDRDYFTISDTEIGQVEVWKIEGGRTDKTMYVGSTGLDASSPAIGGWEDGIWSKKPKPVAPKNPGGTGVVPPIELTPPFQGGNPWGGYSEPPPAWNPYSGGASGSEGNPFTDGNPYQGSNPAGGRGGEEEAPPPFPPAPKDEGREEGQFPPPREEGEFPPPREEGFPPPRYEPTPPRYEERPPPRPTQPFYEGFTPRPKYGGGDRGRGDSDGDDNDQRRRRSFKRQAPSIEAVPAVPAAPLIQVTVRLVATWRAPQGVKPTKNQAKNTELRVINESAVNSTEAKGCCGNAIWYD